MEQSLEEVSTPFVADTEAAITEQPGQRALDHPAVPAQALAGIDAAPGDSWGNAASAEGTPQVGRVIRFVGVELRRPLAWPTGLPLRPDDGWDGIDERE